jgi:aminoglycoside phosphotransferase (APT) family kinase protein
MARFTVEHVGGPSRFVLRADPPPGQSILDTDRSVEWAMLSCLCEEGSIPMPAARWFDPTGDDLGSPAIVLDQVDGEGLAALIHSNPQDHGSYVQRLAGALAAVHGFDTERLPATVTRPTSWDDYIDGCIAQWRDAEAVHVEHEPFLRLVAAWLDANRPPPAPLRLVHGDFQAPNVLVQRSDGRFLLIDWELTHIGDPREDLGWWVLAATSQPPNLIANDEDAFYRRYREATGLSEEVVNPATVAYFTVMASAGVFFSLIRQTSLMTKGEATAMGIAYMTNAMPFMHGVWIEAMRTSGAWHRTNEGAPR